MWTAPCKNEQYARQLNYYPIYTAQCLEWSSLLQYSMENMENVQFSRYGKLVTYGSVAWTRYYSVERTWGCLVNQACPYHSQQLLCSQVHYSSSVSGKLHTFCHFDFLLQIYPLNRCVESTSALGCPVLLTIPALAWCPLDTRALGQAQCAGSPAFRWKWDKDRLTFRAITQQKSYKLWMTILESPQPRSEWHPCSCLSLGLKMTPL